MSQTVKRAKDLMEAQEVRLEQETKMDQLELPSTRSQLVFDLPGIDSLDGSNGDAEKERLRRENAALSQELKKRNEALFEQHLKLVVMQLQLFYLSNPKFLNLIQK